MLLTILVTGGLGFIGSHICVELLQKRYRVIILDNCSNSEESVYDAILHLTESNKTKCIFHRMDICNKSSCDTIFKKYTIHSIIHCAGKKSVNESILKPLRYYRENLTMTLNLLECVDTYNIPHFIFSSSATVYGESNMGNQLIETDIVGLRITNPYGQTKYMQEQIIRDFAMNNLDKTFVLLRYFNPVGAHPSGLIGENPKNNPNNLMPYLLRVAANNCGIGYPGDRYKMLTIFGTDYETPDGTCIRDFIHVVDLAKAHVNAIKIDAAYKGHVWVFNIGTGKGTSVQEMVFLK